MIFLFKFSGLDNVEKTIFKVTVVGTRVLQGVRAVDVDQPGPYSTVQYAVLPGAHSVIIFFFRINQIYTINIILSIILGFFFVH